MSQPPNFLWTSQRYRDLHTVVDGGLVNDTTGIFTWEPSSLTAEQFWSQMGFFAYDNATALAGVTDLVYNGSTNQEGIDIESPAPNLVSFSAPNLTAFTGGGYWRINNAPNLTTVLFPLLQIAPQGLGFAGNPSLANVQISSLIQLNGNLDFSGESLTQDSVNHILSRLVICTTDGSTPWAFAVNLSGGTNAAPTGQGILDAATLTGRGATVTTN